MLEEALPEGVVEDGGRVSGFIFFQRPTKDSQVQLQFQVRDAKTGQLLGTGNVPFLIVRGRA